MILSQNRTVLYGTKPFHFSSPRAHRTSLFFIPEVYRTRSYLEITDDFKSSRNSNSLIPGKFESGRQTKPFVEIF
ncbi:hypothetical protein BWD12_02255 [Leptospira santarosai serovar Bananal]|uniref:Uncharacterized protein n=1 Tax=Leptospira santarosai TaxID=28183 RepID=A0AB73NFG0_9LEPT|nr:hypothetical protein BWD11_06500 [Leptospira santarosai serovar Grippotyphosa]ONF81717.1 hypothetical protein BWD12_02255 [Leptospira santarosai serovar Bananal]ONF87947.1 hypothetical protein BWD13_06055 [Leptospira santarosai serovar Grippotyphosa]ONF94072.1 hypothetical protein BWD14_05465 [Leptospira santarosai]